MIWNDGLAIYPDEWTIGYWWYDEYYLTHLPCNADVDMGLQYTANVAELLEVMRTHTCEDI